MRLSGACVNRKGALLCAFMGMGKFADAVRSFSNKAEARMSATVRSAALEALTRTVMLTPVDKGPARGNWQVSLDGPITAAIDRKDKPGDVTIDAGSAVIDGYGSGQTIFVVNNLPYIRRLETGHSQQGKHMVQSVIDDWAGIVDQALEQAKRSYP